MTETMLPTEFRPPTKWLTFENRCLVCSKKLASEVWGSALVWHLDRHVGEGVMERGDEGYRQTAPHPIGFPGPKTPPNPL